MMKQSYTSQGIIDDYPVRTKPILVHFFRNSEAYQKFGAWIVCTLLEQQEVNQANWADFPVHVEISAQANAPRTAGRSDDNDIRPVNKKDFFRGSEVSLIKAYNKP
ncbi:MAG: hypothetical protein ACRYFV_04190 [Janthinobacterium lividum]